ALSPLAPMALKPQCRNRAVAPACAGWSGVALLSSFAADARTPCTALQKNARSFALTSHQRPAASGATRKNPAVPRAASHRKSPGFGAVGEVASPAGGIAREAGASARKR